MKWLEEKPDLQARPVVFCIRPVTLTEPWGDTEPWVDFDYALASFRRGTCYGLIRLNFIGNEDFANLELLVGWIISDCIFNASENLTFERKGSRGK